ncbi:hypothetical protein GGF38_000325, partial [Coemansia sp. RSA 25]
AVVAPPVVGVVTPATSATPTPVVVVPGAVLPTPASSTPTPGAVVAPTPAKPTSSSTKPPPVAVVPPRSSTLSSSLATKPPAQPTPPTPAEPTPAPTVKTTTVGGGVPGLGGGGGSPETGKTKPANVFTATAGSGGVLEYGSCISFESQCNGLCSHGIYSMNCVSGGLCLCYQDDPESTPAVADQSGNAEVGVVSDTSLASRQLPKWSISALTLAALAISAAFF